MKKSSTDLFGCLFKRCGRRPPKKHTPSAAISWKDTTPWKPPITGGTVIKVYDGDTITIAEKLPYAESPLFRWSVRLDGIDTPEMKSKSHELKCIAEEARDELSNKVLGKHVELRQIKPEKYGRILATVYLDGENLSTWLLDEKYAYQYNGEKKMTEEEQLEILVHT